MGNSETYNRYLLYDTAVNGMYTAFMLQEHCPVNRALFAGTPEENLLDVMPWLFKLDGPVTEKITGPDGSYKAAVIVDSVDNLEVLLMHLKKMLYKEVDGQAHFFRFWDARVLHKILPRYSWPELAAFFGPVHAFIADDGNGTTTRYTLGDKTLQTNTSAGDIFGRQVAKNPQAAQVTGSVEQAAPRQGQQKAPRKFIY